VKIMKINCEYAKIVPLSDLQPHPKNRNVHPVTQIVRLADLMKYYGWRKPIIVSNLSGYIVSGHGRARAAKLNGWIDAPVVYQDFDNSDDEYGFLTSDNAISEWSNIDLAGVNYDLQDIGPDFEIDMLGINGFEIEPADKNNDESGSQEGLEKCELCGQTIRPG
jgi:hypothetical protein